MKICIIAEGSYPYVSGGVSSWIQMLTTAYPEHQFIIYAIAAEKKMKGIFKYDIPKNITQIYENFLDNIIPKSNKKDFSIALSQIEKNAFVNLITGSQVNWDIIFGYISNVQKFNVEEFLSSNDFFDVVDTSAQKKYPYLPFTEYFWTIRALLYPFLKILNSKIPQADLYHSVSTGYAGLIGSYANFLYNKPFIITEHGIYSREREEEIIKSNYVKGYFKDLWIDFFYSLSKCAYYCSNMVLTLFNKNKELQIELGCPLEKLEIVGNGIDLTLINKVKHIQRDDSYFNIGAIIRVVPIKDIKTMIQGFAHAKEKFSMLRLYIMGSYEEDPLYYEECKQLISSLCVEDVIFTGKIAINEYIDLMDIIVLTSISEGQPFALLEAMAYKKAVISTDVGCCRELIDGYKDEFGTAGIIIPVMDYERLGNTILTLAVKPNLCKFMGQNGYNRVSNLYNLDKFVNRYSEIYRSFEVNN